MYNYNHHIHFIGIGGVGMAGIAEILLNLGYSVSGSDLRRSSITEHLESLGATIAQGQSAQNIPPETRTVVVSTAISRDNEEFVRARERELSIVPRAEMLAELMRMKYGIAVAGSHGKTTTTSLIGHLLGEAGLDPTVIVGGRVLSRESGAKLGMGEYLVAEADESDGSFHHLRPAIPVVTNVDLEHLDYYSSLKDIEESFYKFVSTVPFYGVVVLCADDPILYNMRQRITRRVITYGIETDADVRADNIVPDGNGTKFDLLLGTQRVSSVYLPMPGRHMVLNALAAASVAQELGVYADELLSGFESFSGVSRRSEIIFKSSQFLIIDDYGHHPTEIQKTLLALRQGWIDSGKYRRLVVVFQPHRFSRTKMLWSEFVACFNAADMVLVTDIYPAGEQPIAGVDAESLADALDHQSVNYVGDLERALDDVASRAIEGDLIVTCGAGSITSLGRILKGRLSER